MIRLTLDDFEMDLGEDFAMDLQYNNPFLSDSIQASYSIPWTLPDTPNNRIALEHASHIKTKTGSKEYRNVTLFKSNIEHRKGVMILNESETEYNKGEHQVDFIVDGFPLEQAEKKLSEIEWPADVIMGADTDDVIDHMKDACQGEWPEYNYAFPMVRNDAFYDTTNPLFEDIVNRWDILNQVFYKNTTTNNRSCVVPYLYLPFILQTIFKGLTMRGSFFREPDCKKIIVHNNYANDFLMPKNHALVGGTGIWQFLTPYLGIHVNMLTDESTAPFEDPDGAYDAPNSEYIVQTQGPKRVIVKTRIRITDNTALMSKRCNLHIHCNGVNIGTEQILNMVYNQWYDVEFSGYKNMGAGDVGHVIRLHTNFEQALSGGLYNNCDGEFDIDATTMEFIDIAASKQNTFALNIHYANHVPDIKVTEFLAELKNLGIGIQFDYFSREVFIDIIDDIWKNKNDDDRSEITLAKKRVIQPSRKGFTFSWDMDAAELTGNDDIEELPAIDGYERLPDAFNFPFVPTPTDFNQVFYVANSHSYYISVQDPPVTGDIVWRHLYNRHVPYVIGNGENEINSKFSPLIVREDEVDGYTLLLPVVKEKGSSNHFDIGINKPKLKLSFFWGMRETSSGEDYPMATPYGLDYGGRVLGTRLVWEIANEEDFFKKWCIRWYTNLVNAKRMKVFQRLSEEQLRKLNYMIPFSVDFSLFVYESVLTTYTHRGIEICECDLIKID